MVWVEGAWMIIKFQPQAVGRDMFVSHCQAAATPTPLGGPAQAIGLFISTSDTTMAHFKIS